MSTTTRTFEQYLSCWNAEPPRHETDRCPGCGRSHKEEEPAANSGECRACMKYHWGYDQARDTMLDAMIGGAVRGALQAGVPSEEIVAAVARAIDAERDQVEDELYRTLARATR